MARRGLVFLILLLLTLPAVWAKDPLVLCEGSENEYHRSNCYLNEAMSRLDWDYCSFIKYSGARKTECFVGVALKKVNSSLCESLETRSAKGQCNEGYALLENDTSLCNLAEDYKGHCYYSLASKLEEVALCEEAEAHKPRCLYEAAVRLKDSQYCAESENPEQCYYVLAQETGGSALCRETGEQEEECLCGPDESLVNHSCVKLNCRGNQAIQNHRCVDLACESHFTAENHSCVPDFLCTDYDGENYGKRSICRSPQGGGWDSCAKPDAILYEQYCRSETECFWKNIDCPEYCEGEFNVSGKCRNGRCFCFPEPADSCYLASNVLDRYECYRVAGISPLGSLSRLPVMGIITLFVIIVLVIKLYKAMRRKESLLGIFKQKVESGGGYVKSLKELNWVLIGATSFFVAGISFYLSRTSPEFTHSLCSVKSFWNIRSSLYLIFLFWKALLVVVPFSFIVPFVFSKKRGRTHGVMTILIALIFLSLFLTLPYVMVPLHKWSEGREVQKMTEIKQEAITDLNPALCFEAGYLEESCLFELAVLKGEESLCQSGRDYTSNCQLHAALSAGDIDFCRHTDAIRNDCYFLFANKTGDTSLCFLLDDKLPISDFGFETAPRKIPGYSSPNEEYPSRGIKRREYPIGVFEPFILEPGIPERPLQRGPTMTSGYWFDCRFAPEWPGFDGTFDLREPGWIEDSSGLETDVVPPTADDFTQLCVQASYCTPNDFTPEECKAVVSQRFNEHHHNALATLNTSLCEITGSRRGECYYQIALSTKESTLCENAQEYKYSCYYELASATSEPALCGMLSQEEQVSCLSALAIMVDDVALCDAVAGAKTACVTEVALKQHDFTLCSGLDENAGFSCYCKVEFNKSSPDRDCGRSLDLYESELVDSAVANRNSTVCSGAFFKKKDCYGRIALATREGKYCDLMANEKEACLYALALSTRDYSFCDELEENRAQCAMDIIENKTLALNWTLGSSIRRESWAASGLVTYSNIGKTYLLSSQFRVYCGDEPQDVYGCRNTGFLLEPGEICHLYFYAPCEDPGDEGIWYPGRER